MKRVLSIFMFIAFGASLMIHASDSSTKKERNLIREGNDYYNEKDFADAEKLYRKALEENSSSELAAYNLATSLIRQSGNADINADNNPLKEASDILTNLANYATDSKIAEYANYNLGNILFNQQQYQQSIELYKNTLRKNPNNDKARQNLRIAQLKLQEQEQQNQNKDKEQEQNQEQNKNQQQNQQQDQKDEQNKDKNNNDEQNGNQEKKENKEQQPLKQEQGSISDANAAKILKTMENEENATRRKVNELKKREEQSQRRRTSNQW